MSVRKRSAKEPQLIDQPAGAVWRGGPTWVLAFGDDFRPAPLTARAPEPLPTSVLEERPRTRSTVVSTAPIARSACRCESVEKSLRLGNGKAPL